MRPEMITTANNHEESLMQAWSSKLKHFLILSSSGKPIWTRHGSQQLISNTIGVLQTIISLHQDSNDNLKSFNAGNSHFYVLSKGHLHLAAISRLGESDSQLRSQLESLYMQILSTLTLPNMEKMFQTRPSTDLRRPLQGTEGLLSALADGFTRGSPSTLLSALECLRIRKVHRQAVNHILYKTRSANLLYGLIVAGGRLVSVLRPRRHSLHPGDLHLIFNMLFEAKGMRATGGENWVPLCLPGFNNTGYVYMYVSFLDSESVDIRPKDTDPLKSSGEIPEIAFILLSASKEAFYDLRTMRDSLVRSLTTASALSAICNAASFGRPTCADIAPGIPILHFLYKSRKNVQFTMPSAAPHFESMTAWRRLMCRYSTLHAALHSKSGQVRLLHHLDSHGVAFAWTTPVFELYIIAKPGASKQAVAQGASKIVHWVKKEEERIFIVGGAVSVPLIFCFNPLLAILDLHENNSPFQTASC